MLVRECYTETVDGQAVQKERWVEMPGVVDEAAGIVLMQAEQAQEANGRTLEEQALTALDNLRAYRDLASPTNAQTVAAVKLLCRVCIGLIRLHLRRYDATT